MAINHLLRQTVSIENVTGDKDLHGKPALGAAVDYRARFQKTNKTMLTAQREREQMHGIVFIAPPANIQKGAKLTYGGDIYRVMNNEAVIGRNGKTHHYELLVQLWSFGS